MWSILKTVNSFLNFSSATESDINVNDILEEGEDIENPNNDFDSKESICQDMNGTVTHLYDDHGLIDGKFYFEFENIPIGLRVGNCVSFIAFKMAANEEWRVKNIYAIQNEIWGEDGDNMTNTVSKNNYGNQQCSNFVDPNLMHSQTPLYRKHIGKVEQRYGRDVVISPGVRCNLDTINVEFLPLAGDSVELDMVYVTDGVTETILKLDNLKPLRFKIFLGQVTHWEASLHIGIISHEVYFSKDVCEPGFIPIIGDEVLADVIESEQGGLVWRALQVLPATVETQKLPNAPRNKTELQQLLQNKQGIYICEVTDVGLVRLGQEKNMKIEVENGSTTPHVLKSCAFCFKNSTPQFDLLHPLLTENLVVPPNTSVTFDFKANARFVGKSSEIFVWTFEGFNIGRELKIEVQDPKTERIMTSNGRRNRNTRKTVTAKQLMATRNGFIVSGVRPIKPPSFVPVSLGMFKVPQALINAVLSSGNKQRHEIEVKTYLCQGYPCLTGELSPDVYNQRWHTILYLEEIKNMIDTSMYNISRATFTRTRGGFLSLEIPGLAERRPSLVVGDRVIVRQAQDESHWQDIISMLKSDTKSTLYEGYIHKILNEEILIKFKPSFHDSCNGDYSVDFHSGRMNFRRFHQAINVAIDHLSCDWLFPKCVLYQSPQVILEEEEEEEKVNGETFSNDKGAESVEMSEINGLLKDLNIDNLFANRENESLVEKPFSESEQFSNGTTESQENDKSCRVNEKSNPNPVQLKPAKANQKIKWNSTSKLKMGKVEVSRINFSSHFKKKICWFNKRLNFHQKQAVRCILSAEARPLPYVIFGPPGTGKTITLVETALQILTLLTDSRLLIGTPSNSAADLVAERLLDSGVFAPGMLLRLISHRYAEDSRLPAHLAPVCAVAEMKPRYGQEADIKTVNGIPIKSLSREEIGCQRVTIGTCTALGILYNLGFPKGHFTHILIDEAGQATEPETLIPLAFLHMEKGQAILAGDPLQLGPVVISNLAADFGLSESFLARLLKCTPYRRDVIGFPDTQGYNPCLVTRLINNYRSLPEILNLPSMMFYDGDLVPLISETNSEEADILRKLNEHLSLPLREDAVLPPAIVFHGVRGSNSQSPESPSWYNPEEAVQTVHYLEQAYEYGLTVDQIGVVTPYQKQASKIRETLEASGLQIPKVGSVEEFQGQERMLMILSTVRSNVRLIQKDVIHSLGFVASPRRLNVALTRARALLIIIGDPHLLSFDNYWRTVLNYCVKCNAYIGCDLPLSVAEIRNSNTVADKQNVSVPELK